MPKSSIGIMFWLWIRTFFIQCIILVYLCMLRYSILSINSCGFKASFKKLNILTLKNSNDKGTNMESSRSQVFSLSAIASGWRGRMRRAGICGVHHAANKAALCELPRDLRYQLARLDKLPICILWNTKKICMVDSTKFRDSAAVTIRLSHHKS